MIRQIPSKTTPRPSKSSEKYSAPTHRLDKLPHGHGSLIYLRRTSASRRIEIIDR